VYDQMFWMTAIIGRDRRPSAFEPEPIFINKP